MSNALLPLNRSLLNQRVALLDEGLSFLYTVLTSLGGLNILSGETLGNLVPDSLAVSGKLFCFVALAFGEVCLSLKVDVELRLGHCAQA